MPGAARFSEDFGNISRNAVTWTAKIWDESGTPLGGFNILGRSGPVFREQGPTLDPDPGIYPTSVEFDLAVENANHTNLISDLQTANRSRFACIIERAGTQWFVGRFAAHGFQQENSPLPNAIRLTGHCGLAELQHVDYDNNGTKYSGDATIIDHIQNCFDKLDIQSYYTGDFITFTVQWVHKDFPDTTTNPLEYIQVNHAALRTDSDDSITCWDALRKICTDFGLWIYHSAGMFHVVQLGERSDASFQRHVYDTSFTETASSGSTSVELPIVHAAGRSPAAGGFFKTLDALSEVDVLLPVATTNLINEGQEWSYLDETTKDIGSIYVTDTNSRIRLTGQFEAITELVGTFNSASEVAIHRYWWKIEVNIGSSTAGLQKKITFLATDLPGASFWFPKYYTVNMVINVPFSATDSEVDIAAKEVTQFEDQTGSSDIEMVNDGYTPIDLITFPLGVPLTVGETYSMTMKVTLHQVIDSGVNDIKADADYSFKWWFRNASVQIVNSDGSTPSATAPQTILLHHKFTNTINAERKKKIRATMGDVPNAKNGLKIWDGTNWVYSNGGWRRVDEAVLVERKFSYMLAHEIMRIRKTSKDILSGAVYVDTYRRDGRFEWDGKYWIPLQGTFQTALDEFNGDWVEISAEDVTSGTETDVPVDISNEGQIPADPGPDAPNGYTHAPTNLTTGEALDDVTAYTDIDVVNPTSFQANIGDWIQITHPLTNETEVIQITEAIDGSATQNVDIASHTFANPFPLGSPLQIAPVTKFESKIEKGVHSGGDTITVAGPLSQYDQDNQIEVYLSIGRRWHNDDQGVNPPDFEEYDNTSTVITFQAGTVPAGVKYLIKYIRPRP